MSEIQSHTITQALLLKDWRIRAISDGKLFDITDFTRAQGILYPVGVSVGLFRVLFPVAEDAAHGASFAERTGELITAFKRTLPFAVRDTVQFNFKIKTFLKKGAERMPHIQKLTGSKAGEDSRDVLIEHDVLRYARNRMIWVKAILGPGDDCVSPVITLLLDAESAQQEEGEG